jgi:glycosyltransferase involved in cell wall biosynthesis
MKLRILHLTQFLGVGGLEKVLFLLINEQMSAGHEVTLMVYDYEQTWVEEFRNSGIKVDTSYRKSEGYDKGLLSYLSKQLKSFDIIHTHDLNPLMYAAPLKLSYKLRGKAFPKLIHTAHGMNHLHQRPVTKLYERVCGKMTDYTIGVSKAVCEYYERLGVKKSKIINIDNGTKIYNFTDDQRKIARNGLVSEFKFDPESLIWVYVARVVPLKNQKMIIQLAKKCPEMNFLLVGPSGEKNYWKELFNDQPANVFILGGRSDINTILLGSDFFISSSTHEGIPIAVLEAGAISMPCLLSDIPGHQAIQTGNPKKVALYFDLNDEQDLYEKALFLKKNKSIATSMASSLHEHVQTNFSSTSMYNRYLNVYLGQHDS